MEPVYKMTITKISGTEYTEMEDTLIREIKLEIRVNDERVGALMCTPVDQEALALGYLRSEGIIRHPEDIKDLRLEEEGSLVSIRADADHDRIRRLNTEGVIISGCGRGSTANISPEAITAQILEDDTRLEATRLSAEMSRFYTECPLYEATGCVHTAKLHLPDNSFTIGEDIAQHNTIDKAVGKAMLRGIDYSRAFLTVSGRLSSEMVAKAVMHRIPILASRTASTCLGVRIAEKFGLTLVGFVRNGRMNIYSHPRRIHV